MRVVSNARVDHIKMAVKPVAVARREVEFDATMCITTLKFHGVPNEGQEIPLWLVQYCVPFSVFPARGKPSSMGHSWDTSAEHRRLVTERMDWLYTACSGLVAYGVVIGHLECLRPGDVALAGGWICGLML